MIRFQVLGTRFCLPLLSLLAPILALQLGVKGSMAGIGISLCIHELAHLLAARIMRVGIAEIQLMPFGGSAKMENPYLLSPIQLFVVAAAGPTANLVLMVVAAALCHWEVLNIFQASAIMQPSLILMLFNLLPALPLDGGRMLYALLCRPIGTSLTLKIGIWLGRLLAGALFLVFVFSGFRNGQWNLTLILAAVFILVSAADEREALGNSRAKMLEDLLKGGDPLPHPVHLYQADAACSAYQALRRVHPFEKAWFLVTKNGLPPSLLDSRTALEALLKCEAPDVPLGDLPGYRLTPEGTSGAKAY